MTAIDNTPTNLNPLDSRNFTFTVKRSPHLNWFVQQVGIPEMEMGYKAEPNPFVNIPIFGDHITYGPLFVTFMVDEEMANYMEIHNWIKALGKPNEFAEFKAIADQPQYTGNGIYSDLSLMVLNSAKNPKYEVIFLDAFPTALSAMQFDARKDGSGTVQATTHFAYRTYEIKPIT